MSEEEIEGEIHEILTSHTDRCEIHKALARALDPFVVINPEQKAKDIANYLEERGE